MEDLREILKRHMPQASRNASGMADISSKGAHEGTTSQLSEGGVAQAAPEAVADEACQTCGGIGWLRKDVPVEHPDFGQMFPCACRQKRFDDERLSRFLRISNLGHLASVTLESLTEDAEKRPIASFLKALEIARAYAEQPTGWLAILGPAGSGKTTLAAAIATQVMRQGKPAFFMSVADLLDHLRSTYAPTSEVTYDELAEQVREVPLLVLDDLGSQSATQWAQEKLWQILGHRYNARMPTVITTDVPLEALDDRLRPRLMDTSLVKVVEIGDMLAPGTHLADSLGLPDLAHMTFETFDPQGLNLRGPIADNLAEAKRLAMGFAQHPEGWLVLAGGYGCGKTHMAAAIAHYRRQQGENVLFIFATDLLDYLRSTFQSDSSSTYQVLDRVKRVGLLILDDFSEPVETGWTREKLYQVLNYRYVTRLPTVITSGIEPELLEPRIWSRMNDSRLSTVYEILAPDYRTGIAHRPRRAPGSDRTRPQGRGRPPSTRRSAGEEYDSEGG